MCSLNRNASPSLGQHHFELSFAALQRIAAEIVTVQFDQVKAVKEYIFVTAPVANAIE